MEKDKVFEYSDIEYLLENVPYEINKDNEEERFESLDIIFNDYNIYEIGKNVFAADVEVISKNLDLQKELQYLNGCVDFYITAFYYFCEKKDNKIINNDVNVTIRKIGENLMQKANAFCYLFIKGDYSDAISISRSIYELVLSAHLIYEYPQLAEPFRDKELFLSCKFYKELTGTFKDYSIKKLYYSLLDKYGDTLYENFGWAAKVFPDKENRFHKSLAKKLELHDVFDSCYQKSCAYVHSSPYSLIHHELHECLSFSGWVVEMLYKYCSDFFSLSFMNQKEKAIMNSLSVKLAVFYINELTNYYTITEESEDSNM